ncbi:MAG: DegV family EDD domain-containing protein, partial [Clostridia bacterium]|nr:DegV family EDD domain-containing protein [Clostridia bacterium]
RFVHVVDSLGCGFGNGMLAIRAAKLSRQGVDVKEAAAAIDAEVPHTCQYFTVDDLNFLKNTGRVSGFTAQIGTVLNIKPILYGNKTGHIVSCAKVRGRKKSIEALAKKYDEKRVRFGEQEIFISHGDCLQDAQMLEGLIREITPDVPVTICQHEPFSGAHVGPGMLGLFFRGNER